MRVNDINGNCFQTIHLELAVEVDSVSASSVEVIVCGEDPNIPVDYDLRSQEAEVLNGKDAT